MSDKKAIAAWTRKWFDEHPNIPVRDVFYPDILADFEKDYLRLPAMSHEPVLKADALLYKIKCWLYPRLTRFAHPPYDLGRFENILASAYKEYDQISYGKGPVAFVDQSGIIGLDFEEVCMWIAERVVLTENELVEITRERDDLKAEVARLTEENKEWDVMCGTLHGEIADLKHKRRKA